MMRVAYLVPPIRKPNGWRTHTIGLLNAISRYISPILFVAQEDKRAAAELFPQFPRFTLPVIQYVFQQQAQYVRMAATLAEIALKWYPEVDLVHSLEAYPAGLFGSRLAARLNRPHLLTAHGTYGVLAYQSQPHRALYQTVLRRTAALCPVSPNTGDAIRAYFPEQVKKLVIRPILNGNHYYQLVPREEALCRQPSEIPTILSVGAVKPRKGYHHSLAAFAQLKRMVPVARYWIVGALDRWKYVDKLKATIQSQGLRDVHFFGEISESELHECYRTASVFLLAPQAINLQFEGFGLVYLEAGAYGLPVVGVRTGGVPSAIRHGETGFVVDPEDVQGLAEALKLLLTQPELSRQMGVANRHWAETLTWEKNAGEHFKLYEEILSQPEKGI